MPAPPQVRIREATFDDWQPITALEVSEGLVGKSLEQWTQLWLHNPVYQRFGPKWVIGWVIEDQGRIVGSVGNIPLGYVLQGVELLVSTGRAWAVAPEYRGYALMLMDAYFAQPDVDLFVNTTVNGLAAEPFSVFGSIRVPTGDWSNAAYWITNYTGFAGGALRVKKLPAPGLLRYPAGGAVWLKDLATTRRLPPAPSGIEVLSQTNFDAGFDPFWKRLSGASQALLAMRDRESLAWHFGSSERDGELLVLSVRPHGELEAYAVFQRRDLPEFGLKRLRLIDFQALSRPREHLLAVLHRAQEECRSGGVHVLENIGIGLPNLQLFDEFAPHRRQLPAWSYYYRANGEGLARALLDSAVWTPSTYDGDASL